MTGQVKTERSETGRYTFEEIMSQPEAWQETLTYLEAHTAELAEFEPRAFDEVIFTGCGSTYYLALAAAALMQELTGIRARALPASEVWLYSNSAYRGGAKTLLLAVSRSGTTTETVRAVESFKARGAGKVLTLSCYPEGTLAALGDLNLVLTAGQEKSVAQTRAFSTLYLATIFLAHVWAEKPASALRELPEACRRLLTHYAPLAERLGRDTTLERFYFLGSGPRYGLACEVSLKMKEMTLSHSEPFHFLEFRHGPQSMVTDTTLMVGFVSSANGDKERAVLSEMKARGAQVLSLAEADADVVLASGVPEALRNLLYLPVVQLLAFQRSLAKGLNPDRPNNLEAVVMLE